MPTGAIIGEPRQPNLHSSRSGRPTRRHTSSPAAAWPVARPAPTASLEHGRSTGPERHRTPSRHRRGERDRHFHRAARSHAVGPVQVAVVIEGRQDRGRRRSCSCPPTGACPSRSATTRGRSCAPRRCARRATDQRRVRCQVHLRGLLRVAAVGPHPGAVRSRRSRRRPAALNTSWAPRSSIDLVEADGSPSSRRRWRRPSIISVTSTLASARTSRTARSADSQRRPDRAGVQRGRP